jgi:4-oxalomesaconate tautomerase
MMHVAAPREGGAIAVRSLIPHRVHASIGVLGAVSVATACLVEGSAAAAVAVVPEGRSKTLGVEHPTGVTECVVTVDEAGQPVEAGMLRTARKLMDGEVFA